MRICISISIFLIFVNVTFSQGYGTIHIIFSGNQTEELKSGTNVDGIRTAAMAEKIAGIPGFEVKLYSNTTSHDYFSQLQFIDGLNINKNDVIMYFYSGHGVRFEDQNNHDYFSYMQYVHSVGVFDNTTSVHGEMIQPDDFASSLLDKARLVIVVASMCNKIDDSYVLGYLQNSGTDYWSAIKMFQLAKGKVVIASSSPGELTSISSSSGTVLNHHFSLAIGEMINENNKNPSWQSMCEAVKENVISATNEAENPIFEVEVTYIKMKSTTSDVKID